MLLHVCCAPDATVVVERLRSSGVEPTLFFYNPNIQPKEEFEKRLKEVIKLANLWDVKLIIAEGGEDDWFNSVKNFLHLPERSKRCEECVKHRLMITARFAHEKGYKVFATTLTVSPKKNARLINSVGAELAVQLSVSYLQSDFKKRNGFLRSVQLSRELGLYRQNYCGCLSSLKEREERDALHNRQR